MRKYGWIFFLVIGFVACKKSDVTVDNNTLSSPVDGTIRFVNVIDGKYIMGGGDRGETGFLLRLNDDANEVSLIANDIQKPLYSGNFWHDRYVFGTEDGTILYSNDLNGFYQHYLKEENFVPTLHQQPARRVIQHPISKDLFIVSGGVYEYGLVQVSRDTFKTWVPTVFDNEFRSMFFTPSGDAWICGLGVLLKSSNGGESWNRQSFDHTYITDLKFLNNNNAVMSTFNGEFFYSNDGGMNWDKADVEGPRVKINALRYTTNQRVVAVGPVGSICISEDGGVSWNCSKEEDKLDLYDLWSINGETVIVVGEAGTIKKISF